MRGKEKMLIDANIFIDFFKKKKEALKFFEDNLYNEFLVSRIVLMEVIAGARDLAELKKMKKTFDSLDMQLIELDAEISKEAYGIFSGHFHKSGIGILDSFLAATAKVYNANLITLNTKHFKGLTGLKVVRPY